MNKRVFSRLLCIILTVMSIVTAIPVNVSAACSHSYVKSYICENENMHSFSSKCTKCGATPTGGTYSGWANHTRNSSGKCTACGHQQKTTTTTTPTTPTCSHSYVKSYICENENMHSFSSKCSKCGATPTGGTYSGWENHDRNSSGRCYDCGHQLKCSHSSTTKVYSYENSNQHSYYTKCNSCGETVVFNGSAGWNAHTFSGNTCTLCGFTKQCKHTNSTTGYTNSSSTQHKKYQECKDCGIKYNTVTENHSYITGTWTKESDTKHKRTNKCACGASTTESASHTFNNNVCSACNYKKSSTPPENASVTLSASGPSGTLGSAGGEISSENAPASYSVTATATNCNVTKIVSTTGGVTKTTNGSSVSITANTENDFTSTTFTAYTDESGVTATFTVNFKFVKKTKSYYMWRTSHEATIRSITGNGLNKSLSYTMTIPNSYDTQTNLTANQVATIQGLIGRNDGLVYTVNYTRTITVYTPAELSWSGEEIIHGSFDGASDSSIESCLSQWDWAAGSASAIRQAAKGSLSFTASGAVSCTAKWIDTSTNKELYSTTFGEGSVSPSQSRTVSISYSAYSGSGSYVYESLSYSGDTSGTSTSQSYSQTMTSSSKPLTVTFYCHSKKTEPPKVTTGSITVIVKDAETYEVISGASVSGAGKSGSTGSDGKLLFKDIALGTHTFSASKTGYESGSGKGTITAEQPTTTVTIYLKKKTRDGGGETDTTPKTGGVTVYVKDNTTNAIISSAYVSGGGNGGYTNSSGYVAFSGLSLGTYTFTASKSGYYSNSGTASITTSNTSPSLTIYLTPVSDDGGSNDDGDDEIIGAVRVYVRDNSTNNLISGATVSVAGTSKTTTSSGYVTFSSLTVGTYTFTASKSGYNSNSGSSTVDSSSTEIITIYLDTKTVTPTSGDITVYVKDKDTGTAISGASIYGGGASGTTNVAGYVKFNGLSFGSYSFTASASGYTSNSGSAEFRPHLLQKLSRFI